MREENKSLKPEDLADHAEPIAMDLANPGPATSQLISFRSMRFGRCWIALKSEIRDALDAGQIGTQRLTDRTRALAEQLGAPVIVALQECGFALFEPKRKPVRVLPPQNDSWPNGPDENREQFFRELIAAIFNAEREATDLRSTLRLSLDAIHARNRGPVSSA